MTSVTDLRRLPVPADFHVTAQRRTRPNSHTPAIFLPAVELLMAADFPAARRTLSTPARSAASTMVASRVDFLPAGVRVSAEALMPEASLAAEDFMAVEVSILEEVTGEHDADGAGKSTDGEETGEGNGA
jgi:hypothetical protein